MTAVTARATPLPRLRALFATSLLILTVIVSDVPEARSQEVPATVAVVSPASASTTPEIAYLPNTLVLPPGGSIQYANADTVSHNITSRTPGLFESGFVQPAGAGTVDLTGVGPGEYDFFCTLHPTMEGTLTILGAGGGEPEPEPSETSTEEPSEPNQAPPNFTDPDIVYESLAITNEPMALDIADDGRIVWVERGGIFQVLVPGLPAPVPSVVPVAGNLCEICFLTDPGYTVNKFANDPEGFADTPLGQGGPQEAGLYDVLLDDDFEENNRVYLSYSAQGSAQTVAPGIVWGEWRVSAFTLDPVTNLLDLLSEEVLFTLPFEWNHPAHLGGDLDYLPDGTIVLMGGDNVLPAASGGYGPRDNAAHYLNAELTSANPADRRGKILRFREDGSVPDGSLPGEVPNPFLGMEGWNPYIEDSPDNVFVGDLAGTPGDGWIAFDPYVYSLGWKQAWRAVVMPNGDLYVSDVGPDAGADDPERGPRGFEEVNHVPFGGGQHYGWPRCQGPNWSYIDVDWETLETNGPLDCGEDALVARRIDDHDDVVTGMTGSTFHYPSGLCDGSMDEQTTYDCDQWPIVGSGGKTSEPTVFYPADPTGRWALPFRYWNKLWVLEWSRQYILNIPADPDSSELDLDGATWDLITPRDSYVNPEFETPIAAATAYPGRFLSPIDAAIGPDGAVYFLEYGLTYYVGEVGRLSRIRNAVEQPVGTGQQVPDHGACCADGSPEPEPAPGGEVGDAEPAEQPLPATGAGLSAAAVAVLAALGLRRRRHVLT